MIRVEVWILNDELSYRTLDRVAEFEDMGNLLWDDVVQEYERIYENKTIEIRIRLQL